MSKKDSNNEEETLNRTFIELRILEGTANVIQSRLNVVDAALSDIAIANISLEGIRNIPVGSEALVPAGAGSFIRTKLSDVEKVIVGVGAGVCIEKTIEESLDDLKSRQSELEEARSSLQKQLSQTLTNLNNKRNQLGEILSKRTGSAQTR